MGGELVDGVLLGWLLYFSKYYNGSSRGKLMSESAEPVVAVGHPAQYLFGCYCCGAFALCCSAAARVQYSSFSSVRHCETSDDIRSMAPVTETPSDTSAAVHCGSTNEPRIPIVRFICSTDQLRGSASVILLLNG